MQNDEKLRNTNQTKIQNCCCFLGSRTSPSSGNDQQFELEFDCVDAILCLGFESRTLEYHRCKI